MRFRKLRIAWLAACGVVGVLVVGLWLRSYWRVDILYGHIPRVASFAVESCEGCLTVQRRPANQPWGVSTHSAIDWEKRVGVLRDFDVATRQAWHASPLKSQTVLRVPHGLLAILVLLVGGMPWVRLSKRFGIRDLLVGVLVVAVILGLIVFAVRK